MKASTALALPFRRGVLLWSGFFCLLFFGMVELLLLHWTVRPDRALSEILSGLPSSLYWGFSVLCRSGNVEVELPLLLIFGRILWRKKKEERPVLLYFLAVFVVGTLFEHFLKMTLPRYFPSERFQHDPLTGWEIFYPLHIHVVSSFPSGHTFRALLILLFVDRYLSRFRWIAFAWAVLIMVGVVALGWHWSSDVAGSACLVLAVRPWIDVLGRNNRDLIR